MMDFSTLAVEHQHCLGKVVVKEPSTIQIIASGENLDLTTSLPYVEVVSEKCTSTVEMVIMHTGGTVKSLCIMTNMQDEICDIL
jgi:hypothetical protein